MSDPERPRFKPLDAPLDPAEQGPITGSFQVPVTPALAFEEPLSAELAVFLTLAAKAMKGLRVYASNNEALKRYVDDAYRALTVVLDRAEEVTLNVREDKLLHGKDIVHINTDREESIPYIFYRNAFRRIVIVRGMTREEMVQLLSAVIADYGGFDYAGEDLVTALWRIALPHLRYLTIDAMSIDAKSAKSQSEREDIERIQADIEGIVAQIYKTSATDEDIVAGVSITKEDLEALKEIRQETEEDLDALDVATARAIANINPADLDTLNATLLVESRDSLTTKLLDILIIVAFKEQSAAESVMTMELIQQLFDALLVSQRYQHATHLVRRLRDHALNTDNLKEKHIASHLLRMFATEARVVPLLNTFNDDHKSKGISEITEFLRALGAPIVPHLLAALDFLNSPAHRRLISDLILEHGIPDRKLLLQRIQGAKWFLARDILHIASKLPPNDLAPLIDVGLKNEHPKVREYAVGLLRPYARGHADRLVAERLLDQDLEVRLSAIRVAAARRTPDTRAAFEVLLEREDLPDREPRELRLLMAAYAAICGSDAVPLLDKILAPSLFGRSKYADAQIAAAFALASIGTLAATASLQRGTRTLNTRVREACKKALAGAFEKSPGGELNVPSHDLPPGAAGIPAAKTDPFQMPPVPPASTSMRQAIPPAEGTPVTNRSAKSIGVSADAPDFNALALPSEEKKKEQHPQFMTGPAMGRVHSVHGSREEIPVRVLMGTVVPLESTSSSVHDPSEEPTMMGAAPDPREPTPIPLSPDMLTPLETPSPPLVIARGKPLDELELELDEAAEEVPIDVDVFVPPATGHAAAQSFEGLDLGGEDDAGTLELDSGPPVFPSEHSPPPGEVDLDLALEQAQREVRKQVGVTARDEYAKADGFDEDIELELEPDAFEEMSPSPVSGFTAPLPSAARPSTPSPQSAAQRTPPLPSAAQPPPAAWSSPPSPQSAAQRTPPSQSAAQPPPAAWSSPPVAQSSPPSPQSAAQRTPPSSSAQPPPAAWSSPPVAQSSPPSPQSAAQRTPPVRVVTGKPAAPPPELDLDLDGFAHPLGSRPRPADPLSEPLSLPPRPLPSFNAPARTPSAIRNSRDVMPALPDMEMPTVVRETQRPQDRVNVPSKRGPQPDPQPRIPASSSSPNLTTPQPRNPASSSSPNLTTPQRAPAAPQSPRIPPSSSSPALSAPKPTQPPRPTIPPPATTPAGLVDDLFLDQPPRTTPPPKRHPGDDDV